MDADPFLDADESPLLIVLSHAHAVVKRRALVCSAVRRGAAAIEAALAVAMGDDYVPPHELRSYGFDADGAPIGSATQPSAPSVESSSQGCVDADEGQHAEARGSGGGTEASSATLLGAIAANPRLMQVSCEIAETLYKALARSFHPDQLVARAALPEEDLRHVSARDATRRERLFRVAAAAKAADPPDALNLAGVLGSLPRAELVRVVATASAALSVEHVAAIGRMVALEETVITSRDMAPSARWESSNAAVRAAIVRDRMRARLELRRQARQTAPPPEEGHES